MQGFDSITGAVACFVAEFFIFSLIVTTFVLKHYYGAWKVRHPSAPRTANPIIQPRLK